MINMRIGINGHVACEKFGDCTFYEWLITLGKDRLQCVDEGYV
jgi:hypothetical protein